MNLYFDNAQKMFSICESETCECVFKTYNKEERVGWKEGRNPVIRKGPFEITIKTNFYPEVPKREELIVNITVNGVLLLPLSKACRKADVLYHFNKHEIAFTQYGACNNDGREPATIVQLRENINWENALIEICNICNNYKNWMVSETNSLLDSLLEHEKTGFNDIATLLELLQVYDVIVPDIIPIYKNFMDSYCIGAMRELLNYIEVRVNSNDLKEPDRNSKKKIGDFIWNYIRDFYMRI